MTHHRKYVFPIVGIVVLVVAVSVISFWLLLRPPFPNIIGTAHIDGGAVQWEDSAWLVQLSTTEVAKHLGNNAAAWHPEADDRATRTERVVYRPSDRSAVVTLRRDDGVVVVCRLDRRSDGSVDITMIYPK